MLRLRRTWTGKLVLQVQVFRYCPGYEEDVLVWRDATVGDILCGSLSNEKLPTGILPSFA